MKHLFPYVGRHKGMAIIAPLFKMLEAGFDLLVPLLVANMIDVGIPKTVAGDSRYLWGHFALLVGMAVLGLVCSVIAQYFSARVAVSAGAHLRHDLYEKIQSFGFPELDSLGTSTLITRVTTDVNQVQNGINMFLRLFLRSPFIVFGAMILAFAIDVTLALVFVLAILLLFFIVFGVMRLTTPGYRRVQEGLDRVTEEVRENQSGVRVIRAFGREAVQNEEFREATGSLYRAQIRVGKLAALLNPLTYLVVNSVIILILYLGADKVESGTLLSGNIVALINYIGQILVELVKLANLVVLLGKTVSSANRIGQILDTEPSLVYGNEQTKKDTEEALRFEHVSLRYQGAGDDSLSDISFTAKRGQTIGIIGGTGSGKSSLVHLIPRFYDATSGCVYLCGKPVQTLSRDALLSSVAIVDQKPRLFSGTIRSNMLWGRGSATDEEIWEALTLAQAADFVREKPLGLDEPVTAGGGNFSGGQRQRLTIARAILSRADVLILDDSTSALDFATDAALRHALRTLPPHMTVFIISQRTGSIAHSDKILVLEDGALVGVGTHDELLLSCNVYREIYDSQFGKGEKA